MTTGIKVALEHGYDIENAIEAVSVVGEDPEMVLSYLFEKFTLK